MRARAGPDRSRNCGSGVSRDMPEADDPRDTRGFPCEAADRPIRERSLAPRRFAASRSRVGGSGEALHNGGAGHGANGRKPTIHEASADFRAQQQIAGTREGIHAPGRFAATRSRVGGSASSGGKPEAVDQRDSSGLRAKAPKAGTGSEARVPRPFAQPITKPNLHTASSAREGGAPAENVDFLAPPRRVPSNILIVAPPSGDVLRCSVTLEKSVITFARRCDSVMVVTPSG